MFNKRFLTSLLFTFFIFLSSISCITAYAADTGTDDTIKVLINGKYLNFDVPPVQVDGRTLVPLRAIFEALGASISWDDSTNTVTGTKDSTNVVLQLDNPTAYVNGSPVTLTVPGTLINNKTMVPTRFIAESMNCVVSWDDNSKTVIIMPNKTIKFDDSNLEAAVKTSLNTSKSSLTTADVASLKTLDTDNKSIKSLEGLQYCINLERISISKGEISDISELSNLVKLEDIYMPYNKITDISPLKNLVSVKTLFLQSNDITDISSISGMKSLETLALGNNNFKDISVIKNLTSIKNLFIQGALVQDITPVSNLKDLEMINLSGTQVNDLTSLKDNTKLTSLNILDTAIIDVSPLKSLKSLKSLYFDNSEKTTEINDEFFTKYSFLTYKAKTIVDSLIKPNMSDLDKERALHDYIILNTKYDHEGYINGNLPDESHQAYGVLMNKVGVCDGYAYAMKALLNLAKVNSIVVYGDSFDLSSAPIGHAWNMVVIDGKYYHVDLTWDDLDNYDGFDNNIQHKYFNISDKQISTNHKYIDNFYPEANTDSADFDSLINEQHNIAITDTDIYITDSGYIYRIDKKTKVAKKVSDDEVYEIAYNNGWIYYINYSDKNKIYKIKADGSGRTQIGSDPAVHMYIKNNKIYYIDRIESTHKVHQMDLDGSNNRSINYDNLTTTLYVNDNNLYYKAYNRGSGSSFIKTDLNGNDKTTVTTSLSGFNENSDGIRFTYYPLEKIKDGWVYYVDSNSNNNLYKVKIDGTQKTKVSDDNISSSEFNISGNWIYYRNTNNSDKIYRINIDGTQKTLIEQ